MKPTIEHFFSLPITKTMPRSVLNHGVKPVNENTHDIDGSISIGLGTTGIHALSSSGVAIGQNVYGSDAPSSLLNLDKSVLIGSEIFPGASTSGGLGSSIIIGADIGSPGSACSGNLRNTIIGHASATLMANGSADNVIVGTESLNRTAIGSGVVAIGASVGRGHATSGGTIVSSNSILIGKECARNNTTALRIVGESSMLLGCGEFVSGDVSPPADCVCLGRGSLSNVVANTMGQICIGSSNHNTCILETDTSIQLRTTSTFISNAGNADTHATTFLCGLASQIVYSRLGFKMLDVAIQTNRHITDHDGKSLGVGNSFWLSGRSDITSPTEKRRMIVRPNQVVAADDSSTRSLVAYDGFDGSDDTLMPSERTAADARMIAGTRIATSSEMYVYFERPPDGWKCVGCRLDLFNKGSATVTSKQIEIFSRKYLTTANASPTNADHLTIHVDQSLDRRTSVDVPFTVHWTPSYNDYLVGHISNGSSSLIFMGGYLDIERI